MQIRFSDSRSTVLSLSVGPAPNPVTIKPRQRDRCDHVALHPLLRTLVKTVRHRSRWKLMVKAANRIGPPGTNWYDQDCTHSSNLLLPDNDYRPMFAHFWWNQSVEIARQQHAYFGMHVACYRHNDKCCLTTLLWRYIISQVYHFTCTASPKSSQPLLSLGFHRTWRRCRMTTRRKRLCESRHGPLAQLVRAVDS